MKTILIDNYDSFTYNIVYLLKDIGISPIILQNDSKLTDLEKCDFKYLIISPGPSHPKDSGICIEAIKKFASSKKILGICLGHQCIAEAFNGEVVPLDSPKHGKTSKLIFNSNPIFKGLNQGIKIALYNSLHVKKLGDCESLAVNEDGINMALKAKNYNCYGLQFHPESILQEKGRNIMKNFFRL